MMNGRASGIEVLRYSCKQAGGMLLGGLLGCNMPGLIFNVLIQMVRNDLSVHRWISVQASYVVFNLTGKVILIKRHCG